MCALQVQTPLEEAVRLSEQIGNTMLLKREDMQPVRALEPEPPPVQAGFSTSSCFPGYEQLS